MKKIYLSVLASMAFLLTVASPDIYTPELVAPNNAATGSAPNVELNWNPVTGLVGLYYEIQLSTDEAFTNPVLFTTELTALRMSELYFGNQYFWRVRAKDSQATSEWSASRSFTVIVKPAPTTPSDGALNAIPNIELKWGTITGISFFDCQVDVTPTFDSPSSVVLTVPGSLNKAGTSSLLFGQVYYWRVRARHQLDTTEWSVTRTFTVLNEFEIENPDTNAVNLSPDVEFAWNNITGVTKYDIYVATNNQFDPTAIYTAGPTLTTKMPDTLLFGTQYFWKMAAVHLKDTLFSETRNFTTVDKVTLSSPVNNATNVELVPFLKWDKISGVLSYKIEFSSHPDMTSATTYSANATTGTGLEQFKMPSNLLDSANTYYWRVRAISSRDTSNWSDTWKFRCVALGVDAPAYRNGLRVYPSPAVDVVNIELKSGINNKATVTLYDLLGKAKAEREVQVANGLIKDFQLGSLSNGIYILKVESQGNSVTSKLIIKK